MVRELFVMAREASPSIIFMDEIDSIGSSRQEGGQGGDSEVQRTMLELLNQLDGFEPAQNIKVRGGVRSGATELRGVVRTQHTYAKPFFHHRSSWLPTVSTSSTRLCSALGA